MPNNYKKISKQYIKNVKHSLPPGFQNKKNILKDLRNELNIFFNEYPDSTYEFLCNEFGSPESYVNSLISLIPPNELLRKSHLKKRTYIFIAIIIIVIVFSTVALSLFSIWYYDKNKTITYKTGIIMNDDISMDD